MKMASLDHVDEAVSSNYRPVANVPFLSRLLSGLFFVRVWPTFWGHNLIPEFLLICIQKGHSMETAVLMVFSDLVDTIEKGDFMLMSLLDLTTAFDTVDHDILWQRLSTMFGINDSALHWFQSYIEGWTIGRLKVSTLCIWVILSLTHYV